MADIRFITVTLVTKVPSTQETQTLFSEFNNNSNSFKTHSLDSGPYFRAGTTGTTGNSTQSGSNNTFDDCDHDSDDEIRIDTVRKDTLQVPLP